MSIEDPIYLSPTGFRNLLHTIAECEREQRKWERRKLSHGPQLIVHNENMGATNYNPWKEKS